MTALLSGLHASHRKCRESIYRRGLLPSQPNPSRPYGVYIFREDGGFDHPMRGSRLMWGWGAGQDVWRVGYFGPLTIDEYVGNALVLLESPQLSQLSQVTDGGQE